MNKNRTAPIEIQSEDFRSMGYRLVDRIAEFMISKEGAIAAKNLLKRYSKNAQYFTQTKRSDYAGIERLLEGVVWGW